MGLLTTSTLLWADLTKEEKLFIWTGALAGVILVAAVVLGRVERWRKRQMGDVDDRPEHVGSFREMYERGELSKEEYDKVLRRVAEKAKDVTKPIVPASTAPTNTNALSGAIPDHPPESPNQPAPPA